MMNNQLIKILKEIDKAIRDIESNGEPENLYGPIRYILDLGGKRLRPLLTLLAYRLYDDDFRKIIRPALAVEVFHNFTLMHDDIMDKAPLRRNKPAVHKKWNENIAILSGDVMLVRVYDLLLEIEDDFAKDVIKRFNSCAVEVCEGQQFDMDFEKREKVSELEYLNMIQLKTAALLGFSLEMGGLIAGAPENDLEHLREFGINMGIGFQLMDDLLDVYADKELFGKQVGGDILSNKKTYLLIKALELAPVADYEALLAWIMATNFKNEEKIQAVKAIYDRIGIEKLTRRQIDKYFKKGLKEFNKIDVSQNRKKDLLDLVVYLMNREK